MGERAKIEMSRKKERIIEVVVTEEDLKQMKTEGFSEKEFPKIGVKRYRPARHIIKNKI